MIFAEFPSTQAEGVRLAHTLKLPHLTLRKGRVLSAADAAALVAAGISGISGARVEAGEFDEDNAARFVAGLLESEHVAARSPYTGRCNLYARTPGLLRLDRERIDRLNLISENVTLATLAPDALVGKDQRVATVKIIPFAVSAGILERWRREAGAGAPLALAPLAPRRAALVMSVSSGTTERMLDLAVAATRTRLAALGSPLALELRCAHSVAGVAGAVGQALAAGCDLLLVLGATVSKDRGDVVPAAIRAAGGTIEHFGMPVEPGNMLLTARIGAVPVFNLPGCARSSSHNGLDILLRRLCAGLPIGPREIMGLGVGGLLHSAAEEETSPAPQPPAEAESTPPPCPPRIAALVLAAGGPARQGEENRLLRQTDGVPAVRRVVNAACASRACQVMVVTGHGAEDVEAALVDRPVSLVHNAGHASGLAGSLRCGLRALPNDLDGVVVMPATLSAPSADDVDRLIAAFDPADPAVLVPEQGGRHGRPVLWPRRHFAEMLSLSGATGARGLLEQYAREVRTVAVAAEAARTDTDAPALV
ncbi:hypothetical protein B9N43_02405 [Denitratisoma sp. DHT3]|uniref:NTP transferase domain-containing protein n=1 Tax=Denitratisoma sp. DHT3 TaxID=1981880 RepID=UPI001198862A|nr:NTP transferase domain-containing protein [Denitratisoma sp. DHT3]QDX80212.1 hypothetical protein B9N43_02405 [Denitratisoma sp. DHT3]